MPYTLVFDGDIEKLNFNPHKVEAGPFGLPIASSRGNALNSLAEQEDEAERLEEALHKIAQWSKAYPLSVFPEPDWKKARELLEAGGITLDSISAHCMRHVVEGVGKIAMGALSNGERLDGS